MKTIFSTLLSPILILLNFSVIAQIKEITSNPNGVIDTSKKSIPASTIGVIDGDTIMISYHSPGVRKRIIWGGLVPYDEVWVTGAHNATTLEINQSFIIDDQEITAGTYALFSIPGKKEWIVIINKLWQQHLASEYDEKDDVVRIKVKPKKAGHLERLQYFIEPDKNHNILITVGWEKLRIEFPLIIKKH